MSPAKGKAPVVAPAEASKSNQTSHGKTDMANSKSSTHSLATADSLTAVTPDAATALVPVFVGTMQGQSVQLCDARTLHTFMVVLRDFSNWIKGRIRKFGFVNGVDFISISRSPELASGNRGASIDYHLTLDMAKELSMVENNAKGREARRYFIACEKQVQAALTAHPGDRVSTATPYAVLPGQTLTAEQADTLRKLLTDFAASMPLDLRGLILREGWSKLKSHFKTDYRRIQHSEFNEAVSIICRHIAKWAPCDPKRKEFTPTLVHADHTQTAQPDPVKTLDVGTLISFISGGLIDRGALLRIADASGMALYIDAGKDQPRGFGQAVADQIDDTLSETDLSIIHLKATQTRWRRALQAAKIDRPVPQRAHFNA
jgi:phage anti-repressor protein